MAAEKERGDIGGGCRKRVQWYSWLQEKTVVMHLAAEKALRYSILKISALRFVNYLSTPTFFHVT